jgi:hypothetical protein
MSLGPHDDHGQVVLAERSHDSAMGLAVMGIRLKTLFKMEHKRDDCGDSGTPLADLKNAFPLFFT